MADLLPTFVDCDDRLLMDLDLVATTTAKVIMPVHVYGRLVDMARVAEVAERYSLRVIEDAAECPMPSTGVLDVKCWSFYKNKIIAGEEGGAVAFAKSHDARLARQLRNMGFTNNHDFMHVPRGCNYRLANCLAEKILESLACYSENVTHRRKKEMIFDHFCPNEWRMLPRDAPWVYDLRIPGLKIVQLNAIIERLEELEIPARHGFKSCSLSQVEFVGSPFTVTSQVGQHLYGKSWVAAQEVLYVPLSVDRASVMPFAAIQEVLSS